MLVDYHVHTPYCGHARGKTVEYVEHAVAQGLDEIGFSDHLGRYYLTPAQKRRYWDWGMDTDRLERYVDELQRLQSVFGAAPTIRIGLEIDYVEGAEEQLEPILARFPFDFTLASVHCLPRLGWHHLTRYAHREAVDIYREYFACAHSAVSGGMFSSLAHLDFVWRYVEWPDDITDELLECIDNVVNAAASAGTAMEINANGHAWSRLGPQEERDPFRRLLRAIADRNAAITIGSDAHTPSSVGAALDEIIPCLASYGITRALTFRQSKARQVKLG